MTTAAETYDAVVVGARCAGAALATTMARAGRRVLLVDRGTFPSDTVSTHQLFPDALDILDELGVLDRVRADHRLRLVQYSWRVLGHAVAGGFTPVGGHDRMLSVRRVVLDAALVDTAVEAGTELRLGSEVRELLGAGTAADPVRGVVLATGEEIRARWVIGADGRSSTVARRLGLPRTDERRGEYAMLFAYFRGLPDTGWCHIDVHGWGALMSSPCEDDIHLLALSGPADLTRGSAAERQTAYDAALRRFPAVLNPRLLDSAERIGPVVVVPETMLRGFRRQATGPGWALVGDAAAYKHPATGQGIGDALAQGRYVGEELVAGRDLDGYAAWQDTRMDGHYDFSFAAGSFARPDSATAFYAGLAVDQAAGQEFLDIFPKHHSPERVLTADRVSRYRAAWTYERGISELMDIVGGLSGAAWRSEVPACPGWTVADLVAHIAGVAQDSAEGLFFSSAIDAWRSSDTAAARDSWTAGHVARGGLVSRERLVRDLGDHAGAVVRAVRTGHSPVEGAPDWGWGAPLDDLAVHLADLREALALAPDEDGPIARWGLAAYRSWLAQRLEQTGSPALVLDIGVRRWQLGSGPPRGVLATGPYELFRVISGRRSAAHIASLDWAGDPATYLPVISPYPLPA